MKKKTLTVKNISKAFFEGSRSLKVLNKINIDATEGEFICIIGPNGCGKSTLLKLIADIQLPTAGSLDKSITPAYIPQQDSLMPWLTVEENIKLPAKISHQQNSSLKPKINKCLKKYKLVKFSSYYPAEISGGMKQKVCLIRAMIYRPKLILLDESFSALDAITRIEMQKMLLDLWTEYKPTVICVTHDIEEAIFLSDRIYVMSKRPGKIIKSFNIKAKRPRTYDSLSSQEVIKIKQNLQGLLIS